MAKYRTTDLELILGLAGALADAARLRAFMALSRGEMCVCQLQALLALAPSTVSKHMTILRQAGLVKMRKQGRWVHYRRADLADRPPIAALVECLDRALGRDARLHADRRRRREILACDPRELCCQR